MQNFTTLGNPFWEKSNGGRIQPVLDGYILVPGGYILGTDDYIPVPEDYMVIFLFWMVIFPPKCNENCGLPRFAPLLHALR